MPEEITAEAYYEMMRERDLYKAQRDDLDEQLQMIANTGYGNGYTIAEKAIMATIMDASVEYGPVYARIGQNTGNGKTEKGITIHDAPDGILRALANCPLVAALDLRYGRMVVEPINLETEADT